MKLPKLCLDCETIIKSGSRCKTCQAAYEATRRPSSTERYGKGWEALSKEILKRDRYVCYWCGEDATTADHLVPRSKGGNNSKQNLVAACLSCNSKRGAKG